MRRLAGGAAVYSVAAMAPPVSSLIVTPILTRRLSLAEYGYVAVSLVVVQVLAILVAMGLPTAITRQVIVGGGPSEGQSTLRFVRIVSLLLAALGILVASILHLVVGVDGTRIWAGIAGTILATINCSLAFLRGTSQAVKFVLVASAVSIVGQGGGLLVASQSGTAEGYLFGLAAGYVVVACIGLRLTNSSRGRTSSAYREQLSVGLPTVPHQLAFYLSTGALVLIAAERIGAEQAGPLQVALLIGMAPSLLLNALNNAWAPQIFATAPDERAHIMKKLAGPIAWLMAAVASAVALTSPLLVTWLTPQSYFEFPIVEAASIVALANLVSVWYLCNVQFVFASGKTRGLALIAPANLLLACAGAIALSAFGSIQYIAFSLVIFYLMQGALVAWYAYRVTSIKWDQSALLLPMAVGSASILAILAIRQADLRIGESSWWLSVLVALVPLALTGAVVISRRSILGPNR